MPSLDTTLVTTLGALGTATSIAIVLAGRHQHAPTPDLTPRPRAAGRALEGVRRASAALGAGFIGGVIAFGLPGRLLMRVLAVTSPDANGRLTEADEIVGRVTTGGTAFLVLLLSAVGVAGACGMVLLRDWLPARTIAAGAVCAGIGGGLLAVPSGLLDPANRDFRILSPTWLAVGLCLGLVVVGSLAVAVIADVVVPRWPRPSLTIRGVLGLAPLALCIAPPFAVMGALILARSLLQRDVRAEITPNVAVRGALALAAILGTAWMAASAARILV